MDELKISVITVCYNAERTIERCIRSVIGQSYPHVEYIIVDGASSDSTLEIAEQYGGQFTRIISEPDYGLYDAINKGIGLASGQVIGLLNADDVFSSSKVLSHIAATFTAEQTDVVYGDLDFVNALGMVSRRWRSGKFERRRFNIGWMPPHPTFYCKKELYERFGIYRVDFGTAADYELMLRLLYVHRASASYLAEVLIRMETGGVSNNTLRARLRAVFDDWRAMKLHRIPYPLATAFAKRLSKAGQFLPSLPGYSR